MIVLVHSDWLLLSMKPFQQSDRRLNKVKPAGSAELQQEGRREGEEGRRGGKEGRRRGGSKHTRTSSAKSRRRAAARATSDPGVYKSRVSHVRSRSRSRSGVKSGWLLSSMRYVVLLSC